MIAVDLILFAFLVLTGLAIARLRNLFAVAMLAGLFSLLSAGLFVSLDAVDVAFTEAAVGGGVSTIFMLGALALMPRTEKQPLPNATLRAALPLLLCLITGAALIYGTLDMPAFGSADAPIHHHVAPEYLARAQAETGVPNVVTAVLASYRGYDTMGETTVIFVAAISVLMLLGLAGGKSSRRKETDD